MSTIPYLHHWIKNRHTQKVYNIVQQRSIYLNFQVFIMRTPTLKFS